MNVTWEVVKGSKFMTHTEVACIPKRLGCVASIMTFTAPFDRQCKFQQSPVSAFRTAQ
jgi:hypothetical protein